MTNPNIGKIANRDISQEDFGQLMNNRRNTYRNNNREGNESALSKVLRGAHIFNQLRK